MEKTDDQIAKEREAVASMKGAKSHMETVLSRVQSLEYALEKARNALRQTKSYTPTGLYISTGNNPVTVGQYLDAAVREVTTVLGK